MIYLEALLSNKYEQNVRKQEMKGFNLSQGNFKKVNNL